MRAGIAEPTVHAIAYACLSRHVMMYEMEIVMWKGCSEWYAFCEHITHRNAAANVGVMTANITVRNSLSCIDIAVGVK